MRLSYRQLGLSIHLDHGAGVAVTGGQHDELVEARADAILAGVQTAVAYAEHFEAQMDRGPARKLLSSVLRMFRRPGGLAGGDPGDVRPARLRRRHRAPGPGGARRRAPGPARRRPGHRAHEPDRTVGTAASNSPGSNCLDGCPFDLCPYPPKGQQPHRAELSEAFCRHQYMLLRRTRIRRSTGRWQGLRPSQMRTFWSEMADRARMGPAGG